MGRRSKEMTVCFAVAVLALVSSDCLGKKKPATMGRGMMPAKTQEAVSQAEKGKTAAGVEESSPASPERKPASAGTPDRVKSGKALYQGTCSSCHAPDAKGIKGLGSDLTASEFLKSRSDDELLNFLKVGRRASDPANTSRVEMPARGGNPGLTDENLQDIIVFLRSLARK